MTKLIVFDFETGGVAEHHPNIQLAAVAVDAGWNEIECFQRKIQFDVTAAQPEALAINHYDAAVWEREAVPESQVVGEFGAFLNRHRSIEMTSKQTGKPYSVARVAGYNAATFDGPRLRQMFARHDAFLPAHPQVLCVMQRALWWLDETGESIDSLKLGNVCKRFGIEFPDAHDALADCRATVALARELRRPR